MKPKHLILIIISLIILSLLILITINNTSNKKESNTWAEFKRINTITNKNNIEIHIKNQKDLNNYLKKTGNDLSGDLIWLENTENITFPQGSYIFTNTSEFYYIDATGDIDFNNSYFIIGTKGIVKMTMIENQHNRTIKNLNVIGSSHFEIGDTANGNYNKSSGLTRSPSGFFLQAIKASNANFKNMEFNNAQIENTHIFDIMGCNNFTFKNIANRGYLEDLTEEEFQTIYKKNNHTIYTEFIQIDLTGQKSLTQKKFKSKEFQNNYINLKELLDNTPTTNTTISNIRSVGYKGLTGEALINNTKETSYKPYSSSLGSHGTLIEPYTNILVKNNYIENYKQIIGTNSEQLAPIHFIITSSSLRNIFKTKNYTTTKKQKARLKDKSHQNTNITISNNTYINCPNNYNNKDYINKKTRTSDYIIGYDKNTNKVSKTILTINDKKIKTYDNYYPEEPIHNSYIYVSSNYNKITKTLTREYRKPINKIINIKSKTSSETTETLPNGDSITVKHINNNKYLLKIILLIIGVPLLCLLIIKKKIIN